MAIGNKIIVVLGMHRSGTSAITRGLNILGVDLGDNLYPAGNDNKKGFWEDREILEINNELLSYIDSAYDRLGLINWEIKYDPIIESLRYRAVELILHKTHDNPVWGFKDPRAARLLPFWQAVFSYIGYDVSYVIAIRNPMSMAQSLRNRNGFEFEKSFYLWLEHLIPAVLRTNGNSRIVVNYDRLLDNPRSELTRIAKALKLPIPNISSINYFEHVFLEKELRHTNFSYEELSLNPSVPSQVLIAYELLEQAANDTHCLDSKEIEDIFNKISEDISKSPAIKLLKHQEKQIKILQKEIDDRDAKFISMEAKFKKIEIAHLRILHHRVFKHLLNFWRRFVNHSFPTMD